MSKVKYAVTSGLFVICWVMFGKTFLDDFVAGGGAWNPPIAFLIFWSGIGFAIYLMVRALGENLKDVRGSATVSTVGLLAAFDSLIPPWLVTRSGAIVTTISDAWYMPDWQIGYLLNFVISGEIIWWTAYIIFPIFFFVVLPVAFLKKKRIAELISHEQVK